MLRGTRGGSTGLGELILEHFDALEADLYRFYRLELPEILWGTPRISLRRLRSLIGGLPHESAFGLALGAYTPGWGNAEELLALIAELTHDSNRLFVVANSRKGTAIPKRLELERPPRKGQKKTYRNATSEEIAAMFGLGAIRYTGPPVETVSGANVRARCARGHFTSRDGPCRRCDPSPVATVDA